MTKAVLPIRNKKISDKVELAKLMSTEMAGDPDFPSPNPTLPVLLAAANDLVAKALAVDMAKLALRKAMDERNAADKKLTNFLRQETSYVDVASGGDELKIMKVGLKPKKKRGLAYQPPMLDSVRLKAGTISGQIFVRWKPLGEHFNLIGHQLRYSFKGGNEAEWVLYPETTRKSKMTFISPKPGQLVWIEVRAVTSAGAGTWSPTLCIMAPWHPELE